MATDWLFCPYERGDYIDLPRQSASGWVVATHFGFNVRGRREWAVTIETDDGRTLTETAGWCEPTMTAAEIAERARAVRATWDHATRVSRLA